jgi:hypothetical protein
MRKLASLVIAWAIAMFGLAAAAEAGSITCPQVLGTGETTQLVLTWSDALFPTGTAACVDEGTGNLPNQTGPNPVYSYLGTDYPLIEKDCAPDGGGCSTLQNIGGTSGTFDINAALGDYLLGFKTGQGQNNPDWFVVFLHNILEGSWNLIDPPPTNGLSHSTLWGTPGTPPPPPEIPEPATLLLLGTGLIGVAHRAARRRKAALP